MFWLLGSDRNRYCICTYLSISDVLGAVKQLASVHSLSVRVY